jgi:hypothetical protein
MMILIDEIKESLIFKLSMDFDAWRSEYIEKSQ